MSPMICAFVAGFISMVLVRSSLFADDPSILEGLCFGLLVYCAVFAAFGKR